MNTLPARLTLSARTPQRLVRTDALQRPGLPTRVRYSNPGPALGLHALTKPAAARRLCAGRASLTYAPVTQPVAAKVTPETISWTGRWWPVLPLDSLDTKIPRHVDLLDKSLVVWADSQGQWHCLEDKCPHRLAPLSEGRIEGDTLMCSYHGWTFAPSGKCTNIPQLNHDPKAKAAACSSQRSCSKAYPTRQARGLLWVWPEAGPAAAKRACETPEQPAMSQEDGQSAWFVRDLPMRYDTLLENLLDPAHVPFAHHGVQGQRTSTFSMGEMGCSKVDVNGFVATTPAPFGSLQVAFKAPFHARFAAVTQGGQSGSQSELFVVPMKPGYVRFMSNFSLDYPQLPQPMRQLTKWRKGMTWLDHILERNTIIDGDNYLLHASERLLPVHNGIGQEALRACYMPAPADSGVVGLRTWIQKHAGLIPTCKPEDQARMPPLMSHREVLDRWEQHTKNCSHCKNALSVLDKVRLFVKILGAAAGVAAISEVVASVLLAMASGAGSAAPAAGASLLSAIPQIPVAIALGVVLLCTAAYRSLSTLRNKFFYEDYVHAVK